MDRQASKADVIYSTKKQFGGILNTQFREGAHFSQHVTSGYQGNELIPSTPHQTRTAGWTQPKPKRGESTDLLKKAYESTENADREDLLQRKDAEKRPVHRKGKENFQPISRGGLQEGLQNKKRKHSCSKLFSVL